MKAQQETGVFSVIERLKAINFDFHIDRNGKVQLKKKLPMEISLPVELIPKPIMTLYECYINGTISRENVPLTKFHDKIKTLRRYHLIDGPQKREETPEQKRARQHKYLVEWRHRHK